jgi:hypothetical protein
LQLIKVVLTLKHVETFPHIKRFCCQRKLFVFLYLNLFFPLFRKAGQTWAVDSGGKSGEKMLSAGLNSFPQVFHTPLWKENDLIL